MNSHSKINLSETAQRMITSTADFVTVLKVPHTNYRSQWQADSKWKVVYFFGTGQWTRTYIRTVYCTCTQFNGHFSSCPLENLTRAFGEKFYRSDALPGTNHQKYTGLGFPWNWVSAHGVKKGSDGAIGLNKKFGDIFSHVDTIHQRDRQTDGHQMTAKTALTHIALCG